MNRFVASARVAAASAGCSAAGARAALAARHFHAAAAAATTVRRAATTPLWSAANARPFAPFATAAPRRHMSSSPSSAAAAAAASSANSAAAGGATDATADVAEKLVTLTNICPPLDQTSWFRWLHWMPEGVQKMLMMVHDALPAEVLGMPPWVVTILICTLIIRSAVFPLAVMQQKNTVGLSLMRPEMTAMNDRNQALASKYGVAGLAVPTEERMRQSAEMKGLFKKYNCGVGRSFVMPLVLMPTFMSMFFALRTLGYVDESFLEGGMLWFSNLAQLDHGFNNYGLELGSVRMTIGLPLVNSILIFLSIKCNTELQQQQQSRMATVMKKFMYGFAVMSWPFCSSGIPTGVLIYWCASNIFGIGQAFLLRSDFGRKLFNIPKMPNPLGDLDKSFDRMQELFGAKKPANAPFAAANTQQALNPFDQPRQTGLPSQSPADISKYNKKNKHARKQ